MSRHYLLSEHNKNGERTSATGDNKGGENSQVGLKLLGLF